MPYPLLPFEVVAEIFDFVRDDPATLKSNALVSRTFRHFAQQHLFHRVILEEDRLHPPNLNDLHFDSSPRSMVHRRRPSSPKCGSVCHHATGGPPAGFTLSDLMLNNAYKVPTSSTSCIELARLLDSNPHLATYIRVLHVRSRPGDLSGGNNHWFMDSADTLAPDIASCSCATGDAALKSASKILPSLLLRLKNLTAIKFDAKYDWNLLPSSLQASLFQTFQKPGLKGVDLGHLEVLYPSLLEYLAGMEQIGVSFQVVKEEDIEFPPLHHTAGGQGQGSGPNGEPAPVSLEPRQLDDDADNSSPWDGQVQSHRHGRSDGGYYAPSLKSLHVEWGNRLSADQDHGILKYLDVREVEGLVLSGPFTPATYSLVDACSRSLKKLNLINYTSWRPIMGLSLDSPIAIDLSTLPLLRTLSMACTASEWGVLRLFTHLLSTSIPTNSVLFTVNIIFSGGVPYAPAEQWNALDVVLAQLAFVGGLREVLVSIEKDEYSDLYGGMNINVLKKELVSMLPLLQEQKILVVA